MSVLGFPVHAGIDHGGHICKSGQWSGGFPVHAGIDRIPGTLHSIPVVGFPVHAGIDLCQDVLPLRKRLRRFPRTRGDRPH